MTMIFKCPLHIFEHQRFRFHRIVICYADDDFDCASQFDEFAG